MKRSYRQPRRHTNGSSVKGKLIRVILGITASIMMPILPSLASTANDITLFFPIVIGFAAMPLGIIGAIISFWKRTAGAGFMIFAFIAAIVIAIPSGSWSWMPPLMLGTCIFSSYWHILPD